MFGFVFVSSFVCLHLCSCQILTLKIEFAFESDMIVLHVRIHVSVGFHLSVGFILVLDIINSINVYFAFLLGFCSGLHSC